MRWTVMGVGVLAASAAVGAAAVRAAEEPEAKREKRTIVRTLRAGAYLGVSLGDVGAEQVKSLGLAEEAGALVSEVVEDSPAAKAGLAAGDVIVAFAGEKVRSAAHLSRLVRETPAGRGVDVAYLRGGARHEARVALAEPRPRGFPAMEDFKIEGLDRLRDGLEGLEVPEPPEPPDTPEGVRPPRAPRPPRPPRAPRAFEHHFGLPGFGFRPRLGIEVVGLTDQLARHFKVEGGVLVSSVREGSPAEKAGLRAGDIIVKVDGQPVSDAGELVRQVSRGDEAREATLTVQRDGRTMDVRVQLEKRRAPRGPTT